MPRVVPSQVVDFIDQVFPWANDQHEGRTFDLTMGHSSQLTGLLDLLGGMPTDLLTLETSQYSSTGCSVAAIRNHIEIWRNRGGGTTLDFVQGLPKLNPVTLIRQALSRCHDESP